MQGKVVTTSKNEKWVVYDQDDSNTLLYCVRYPDLSGNEVIHIHTIVQVEDKPKNISWLFMKRRKNNLKGLEKFV